jgi:UDP-N-acetylmuramoyl-tripeptide--D-alanyl-D-alanine ligase
MLELGKYTEQAHLEIGESVFPIVDILVTVGPRSKSIATGAMDSGFSKSKIHSFDTSEKASVFLKDFVKPGDIVLLKGSQGIRLERAVEAIMAHPEDKLKLLCRQEKEWRNR